MMRKRLENKTKKSSQVVLGVDSKKQISSNACPWLEAGKVFGSVLLLIFFLLLFLLLLHNLKE